MRDFLTVYACMQGDCSTMDSLQESDEKIIQSGKSSRDLQRFVDPIVLISAPDRLSNFKNFVEMPFKFGLRTSNDARFYQTVYKVMGRFPRLTSKFN